LHFHIQAVANRAYAQCPIVPDVSAFFNESFCRSRIQLIFYEINRCKGNSQEKKKKQRHAHEMIGKTVEQLCLLAAGDYCRILFPQPRI